MKYTLIRFGITATTPFAVAAPESGAGEAIDLPVAVDHQGHAIVPASSLAGSLRAHLRSLDKDEALMGSRSPLSDPEDDSPLGPSRMCLLGSRLLLDGVPVKQEDLERRTQTAVARSTGVASPKSLRTGTLVPAGVTVHLFALLDGEVDQDELKALGSWEPVLGRARTSGQGRAKLAELKTGMIDLDESADLLAWLADHGPKLFDDRCTVSHTPTPPAMQPAMSFEFKIVDPVHLGGGGHERNKAQLARRRDGRTYLEGSSLKGVFRSRAEYIARSLGLNVCLSSEGPTCGRCLGCAVFGSTGRRGRLTFLDAEILVPEVTVLDHAAIDRATGGAAKGRLYSEEVITSGKFKVEVRLLDTQQPLQSWEAHWLRAVVTDLHDGYVGLGGRSTRGLATVQLVDTSTRPTINGMKDSLEQAAIEAASQEADEAPVDPVDRGGLDG